MRTTGAAQALVAAVLFGAAMPLSKLLLGDVDPWLLAGLLYLGSGIGLGAYRLLARLPRPTLSLRELALVSAAIMSGGVVAPVLLMFGLGSTSASSASLLLNAEGVFTALLAGLAFREHIGRRIAFGMVLIAAGAITLSWPTKAEPWATLPSLLVLGACLAWAIDNNLTRRVAELDATWIAGAKGLTAGSVNLILALVLGASVPSAQKTLLAMSAGLVTYGISLVLFVLALRQLGTARTAAYFSTAPFVGALLAILFGERPDALLGVASLLMAWGVWLHLTEKHEHEHEHEPDEHVHEHVHDAHHQHGHPDGNDDESHTHSHRHADSPQASALSGFTSPPPPLNSPS
jgi:drug/metabolite transporter (DMT)-like permease